MITKYDIQDKLMPKGLIGISDEQISDHWNLYKGYVNQSNKLNEELIQLAQEGKSGTLLYADRRRSYGFEYNGMVLHEYYFGNLKAGDRELSGGDFKKLIEKTWGNFDSWKENFEAAGKMRGIGWAILYADTTTGALTNHFIAEHQIGHIAGFSPVLVLDVWEHAYMVDHKAGGRADYIAAFMQNIDWEKVEHRFDQARSGKIASRF